MVVLVAPVAAHGTAWAYVPGLSRGVSHLGSSFGTVIAGTVLVPATRRAPAARTTTPTSP
ncbi:hypothetical protein ABZ490_20565 [Streptomyces sp. NPDC005811]|uniref:hypothetical protein n=1 Tax=Streptomyces sp. NPDC005811 TaxID=3154565 RepID=UPI0033F0B4F4